MWDRSLRTCSRTTATTSAASIATRMLSPNLGRNFNGSTVQGVGFDEDVLIHAGVEEYDVLAAVTQFDNANLMCAEVASRLFGVPHVIARLYNPDHERAYIQLGIDYTCGTSLVAEDVFSKVVAGHGSPRRHFRRVRSPAFLPRSVEPREQADHPRVGA